MTNKLYLDLLKSTSTTRIALLMDVKPSIQIDKRGKFKHFYIPFLNRNGINNFISSLDDSNFYTVIPLISMYGRDEHPHIILSKQILLSAYSNPNIVSEYLDKQLDIAIDDFDFKFKDKFHYLIFKYKKIILKV